MASERSCSVAMSDPRAMSQCRKLAQHARARRNGLGEDAALMQLCSL